MRKILVAISLFYSAVTASSQTVAGETTLKAAFIYNFTKYIEWQAEDMQNDFIIGVLGNSPVTIPLAEISKTNKAKNRRIVIRYFDKPENINSCNILFIPGSTPFSLASILEKTKKGTLTISEGPGFARQGTALNFIIIRNKLKFEANLNAIADANLNASSQLLKLAVIVDK